MPQAHAGLMQNAQDFLNAYLQEITWEPVAALEYRIASLLPGLMLARVDGKSPAEYLTTTCGARVRKLASEFLKQDDLSFSTIYTRWAQEFAQ